MCCILSFDLGTTFFKAGVFGPGGELLSLARSATLAQSPRDGWQEMGPSRFRRTLRELASELRQQDRAAWGRIARVTYASQANSFLLLDESENPLTPLILWNDRRAVGTDDALDTLRSEPSFYGETGVAGPSAEFAVAKLRWLQRHEPLLWARARRVGFMPDELAYWLTGRRVIEAGAAGLTGLLNIHTLAWRRAAIDALGWGRLVWPDVARAGARLGPVTTDASDELTLSDGCEFVVGALDQYAGAIGAGNVEPGSVSETTGTVLAPVRLSPSFQPALEDRGVFQGPAFAEGLYFQMIFGGVSANLLEALRRGLPDRPDYAQLDRLAASVEPVAQGLRLDVRASESAGEPVFLGQRPEHTTGHRVRAVLEGVAEALQRQVQALCGDDKPEVITSVGGAARSRLWLKLKSDALGVAFRPVGCPEPTCLGAAILAEATTENRSVKEVAHAWISYGIGSGN